MLENWSFRNFYAHFLKISVGITFFHTDADHSVLKIPIAGFREVFAVYINQSVIIRREENIPLFILSVPVETVICIGIFCSAAVRFGKQFLSVSRFPFH